MSWAGAVGRRRRQREARVEPRPIRLGPEDVARAVAVADARLRNHAVTLGYSKLAHMLGARLGTDVANWCTWATWASRTVGHALDPDETPHLLEYRTRRWPGLVRRPVVALAQWSRSVLNPRMAPAIAVGNREIFDEIADHFLEFLTAIDAGELTDRESAERFVAALVAAEPDNDALMLRFPRHQLGFLHYYDAITTSDAEERVQLVLAGNLCITDYEQMRLQPYVEEAFFVAPATGWSPRALLRRFVGPLVAQITTRFVTAIITPKILVPVGEKLRPLPGRAELFPPRLANPITSLGLALRAYESGPAPRARNWASYDDRMRFITGLFHAYHFETSLYEPPFTEEATREVEAARAAGSTSAGD